MARYSKDSPRLNVKIFDGDTEDLLFEIKDRDHMDVSDFFTDHILDQIIKRELDEDELPSQLVVVVSADFKLR